MNVKKWEEAPKDGSWILPYYGSSPKFMSGFGPPVCWCVVDSNGTGGFVDQNKNYILNINYFASFFLPLYDINWSEFNIELDSTEPGSDIVVKLTKKGADELKAARSKGTDK